MNLKKLFITGIPTAGKSYLAHKLANEVGGIAVSLDDFREKLAKNPDYKKWIDFYINKNEEEYLTQTSDEDKWADLVAQSEGLWPAFLEEIKKYEKEEKLVIFESVNILPHLAKKDLDFTGIVLIGDSFENILKRNKQDPRWGNTEELQELEAKTFFYTERPKYKSEAKKYGYEVFESADDGFPSLVANIMNN